MRTSNRLANVQPSLTLEIGARAARYRTEGIDVISLAAGEPDFNPADAVVEAAVAATRAGKGRYTPVAGLRSLREAIAAHLSETQGLEYAVDRIVVSSGAKQAIFNALYALCDEGDEVLIPTPYWTSYPEMAKALGIEPVFCPLRLDEDVCLRREDLAALVTPRTRAIIVNSPSNPSGRVLDDRELEEIAAVVREHDIAVISDDIYSRLIFDPEVTFRNLPMLSPDLVDRTVVVNGLSKAYCMTGWRIGYAAGPAEVIRAMTTFQGHVTSCANAIAQEAGAAAFTATDESHIAEMNRAYRERANVLTDALDAIEGIECPRPRATFYAFPNVSGLLGRRLDGKPIETPFALAEALLDEARVAVVPGEAFGSSECLRVSFACSLEDLQRGIARMKDLFARLEA